MVLIGGVPRVCFGYIMDHITPVSRGGTDADDNLTLACRSCSSRKGTRTLEEWLAHENTPGRAAELAQRRAWKALAAEDRAIREEARAKACARAESQDLESLLRTSLEGRLAGEIP